MCLYGAAWNIAARSLPATNSRRCWFNPSSLSHTRRLLIDGCKTSVDIFAYIGVQVFCVFNLRSTTNNNDQESNRVFTFVYLGIQAVTCKNPKFRHN